MTAAAVLVAVVGVVGLIAFFDSRDESTTAVPQAASAPGTPSAGAAGALLRAGNVRLSYSDPRYAAPLRELAASLGAPDTPATRAAGQAVVLHRAAGVRGVVARALGHTLVVADPRDERLAQFIESRIGRGAAG